MYTFEQIEENLKNKSIKLKFGGVSRSLDNNECESATNIAIIIPYRDRLPNLKIFLNNMHPFLTRQKINYGVYLIEPVANITFNRGILMNAGFFEAIKDQKFNDFKYNCFFFHDVDMIPETMKNTYQCDDEFPTHYAVAVSKWNYKYDFKVEKLLQACYYFLFNLRTDGYYKRYYGGINAFTKEQYENINGFSNLYFGWGAEGCFFI